jgi:PAS domain S-box-containing protein
MSIPPYPAPVAPAIARPLAVSLGPVGPGTSDPLDALGCVIYVYHLVRPEFHYVNRAIETLSGCARSVLLRTPARWLEFVHEDDRARASAALRSVLKAQVVQTQYRFWRADGRWVMLEHTARLLNHPHGHFPHAVEGSIEEIRS